MFSIGVLKRQSDGAKQSDMLTVILFRMYSKKETYVALAPFSRNASAGSPSRLGWYAKQARGALRREDARLGRNVLSCHINCSEIKNWELEIF